MIDTPYPQHRVAKTLGKGHSACHGEIFKVRHAEDALYPLASKYPWLLLQPSISLQRRAKYYTRRGKLWWKKEKVKDDDDTEERGKEGNHNPCSAENPREPNQ